MTNSDFHRSAGSAALPSTEEQLADYVYSIQNYTDAKEVAAHLWPILNAAQGSVLREALSHLVGVIDAAGLLNLSNGVQLGPTVWYIKANDAMDAARAALAAQPPAAPVEECPRPVIPDHSAKACVESGNCGCGHNGSSAATDEPIAFVPVHPRNGPLWSDTYAAASYSERSPNYPRMALYAVQPQSAQVEKCTLCAAEESPGFYTGCMVKDGHAPEWDCDGKGNLTRIAVLTEPQAAPVKHPDDCDCIGAVIGQHDRSCPQSSPGGCACTSLDRAHCTEPDCNFTSQLTRPHGGGK